MGRGAGIRALPPTLPLSVSKKNEEYIIKNDWKKKNIKKNKKMIGITKSVTV